MPVFIGVYDKEMGNSAVLHFAFPVPAKAGGTPAEAGWNMLHAGDHALDLLEAGGFGGGADLFFGAVGLDELEPVAVRAFAVLFGDDLHHVAVLQHLVQGGHLVVDQGADRLVADLGVYQVGVVDGRGLGREVEDVALGREDEDAVAEDVDFEIRDEIGGAFGLALYP